MTGINEIQCRFANCSKTFATKSGLQSHIDRVHKGLRYKCHSCNKHLTSKYSFNRHLSLHDIVSDDENENADRQIQIVRDQVDEIIAQDKEDEIIQQQRNEIEWYEIVQKRQRQIIKTLRQQVKSLAKNNKH